MKKIFLILVIIIVLVGFYMLNPGNIKVELDNDKYSISDAYIAATIKNKGIKIVWINEYLDLGIEKLVNSEWKYLHEYYLIPSIESTSPEVCSMIQSQRGDLKIFTPGKKFNSGRSGVCLDNNIDGFTAGIYRMSVSYHLWPNQDGRSRVAYSNIFKIE